MNTSSLRRILIFLLILGSAIEMNADYISVNVNGINYELYYTIYNPNSANGGLPLYGASYAVADSAVVGWNRDYNGFAEIASSITSEVSVTRFEYYPPEPGETGGWHQKSITYTWNLSAPVTAIGVRFSWDTHENVGGGFTGSGLSGVSIPNTVKYIYACAFNRCTNMKSVAIPNSVTIIGSYYNGGAFEECSSLTDVTIGNSVKIIGDCAFADCSSLMNVNIPNSVEIIGLDAFRSSGLTSVTIPNSVISIRKWAFRSCSSLRTVTIGKGLTSIGGGAFKNCTGLNRVNISDLAAWCKMKYVYFSSYASEADANPLYYAHRLFLNGSEVIDLVIPNSVDSISNYAFIGFSGMSSLTIPNSVTCIGNNAFQACTSLASASIGNSVTYIGRSAFGGCSGLTRINIPSSITTIISMAFQGCNNLNQVDIEDLTAWCKINFEQDDGNEWQCTSNPVYYAHRLSLNGSEVNNLVIPNTVDSICDYAFIKYTGMTSVMIPNSVKYIGCHSFSGCSGLTDLNIPNSVTKIDANAFRECTGLNNVMISNSVTEIGNSAFNSCRRLTNLTFGNSLAYIRNLAFQNCSSLSTIYSKSEIAPSMDNTNCFSNSAYNRATVYVPVGSKRDYELTNYWNNFANIVEMNMAEPGDVNGDEEVTIADVNAVIDFILSGQSSTAGDVNNDGEVTIADINAVIDIILSGN